MAYYMVMFPVVEVEGEKGLLEIDFSGEPALKEERAELHPFVITTIDKRSVAIAETTVSRMGKRPLTVRVRLEKGITKYYVFAVSPEPSAVSRPEEEVSLRLIGETDEVSPEEVEVRLIAE